MNDKYGYIGIETLLNYCQKSVDHAITPNVFMRMNRVKIEERPHGKCKTCKYYIPYRDQFSYNNRGDGYCKSAITTSEGTAYINCHDEWYCANYEKEGEAE